MVIVARLSPLSIGSLQEGGFLIQQKGQIADLSQLPHHSQPSTPFLWETSIVHCIPFTNNPVVIHGQSQAFYTIHQHPQPFRDNPKHSTTSIDSCNHSAPFINNPSNSWPIQSNLHHSPTILAIHRQSQASCTIHQQS